MKQTSEKLSEEQFNERGSRYQRANAATPTARSLEFAPYALLIGNALEGRDTKAMTAADVLCGPGVLTRALGAAFEKVVGLDVSAEMLSHYPAGEQAEALRVPLSDQQELLENLRPDVILGLAGLHHVFVVEDGVIDPEASTTLQVETICSWASTLAPGGVLVAGDGTHMSEKVAFSDDDSPLVAPCAQLEARYRDLLGGVGLAAEGPLPGSLAAYRDTVLAFAPIVPEACPAEWFGITVNEHGVYGHSDHFLHPNEVVQGVRAKGKRIDYCELPAPWVFPTLDAMVFFFYELFAFGPAALTMADVGAAMREKIIDLVRRELGIYEGPGGSIAIGWRLGYYVVRV